MSSNFAFLQQLDEWRQRIQTTFEEIEENMVRDENMRGHVEVLIKDNRISASKIQRLESDFVNLKLGLSENVAQEKVSSDQLSQNESAVRSILKNQQDQIE